jgi:uncharacterized protein with GYD domain
LILCGFGLRFPEKGRTELYRLVIAAPELEKEKGMATYILLTRLTDEGCATLTKNPDRINEVNKDVEAMGAKLVAQYVVLGQYDFVNIVDAPNNETMAKISVQLASRGTMRIMTLPAIGVDTFIENLK